MTVTTPGRVPGYYRAEPSAPWAPAYFGLGPTHLDLLPATAEAAGAVPVERLALVDVVGLDEVAPAHEGVRTVRALIADGRSFDAALPDGTVDALVVALSSAAAVPAAPAPAPVLPVTAPVAPVPVTAVPVAQAPTTAVPAAAAPTVPEPVSPTVRPRRDRSKVLLAVLAATATVALGATSAVFWRQSQDEAARADTAEATLASTRTDLADTRTRLAGEQKALADSRAETTRLEARVSQLGNEKAKAQDERNAAEELARLGAQAAQAMLECRDRVLDVLDYVVDEYYLAATTALDSATPICQAANTAVAAFTDAAG